MRKRFVIEARTMTTTSDERLLEQARGGDRKALELLLERHEPQVYRFALRMCTRPEDAQDVLQETLLAAYKGIREFRGDANLSTWLFQVARSFCTKVRRRRVGEPVQTESLDSPEAGALALPESESPHGRTEGREVASVLRAALASLPEHYREVLLLKDVEGLSAEEVAEVVGEKVPAVKSRLHRARLELRRLLEPVLGEGSTEAAPCPELAEELAGYAGGEIDRNSCERMEAHMASCRRCTDVCESLKSTVRMCSRVDGDEVPAPIKAAIRQALGAATTT
jgi:RNA polymerase sigma-70 factor (ECF subfamily)